MPYLLRQARRSTWSGEEQITEERRAAAEASFSRRDVDTDGVSMFMINDDATALVVVAAYACTKMEEGKQDLIRVEDDEVAMFGDVTVVEGDTPVRLANALHRTLNWSAEALAQLVALLLERRRIATRYQPRQVRAAVVALDPQDVAEGASREWVLMLQRARP